MAKAAKSLEQSFEELEEITKQLEEEEVTLEASFQLYQDGMKLLKNCNTAIDKVEKQLIVLAENEE